MKRHCIENYGLVVNMSETAKGNSIRIIVNKNKKEQFNECNDISFYDLTTHDRPTMNVRVLLGLGPKFCVQAK